MLGDNIKQLRENKNLSINSLARRCSMSPGYLSDLEKGKKENPSLDTLEKIASELDTTVQQLFKETINEPDEIDELEADMKLLYSKIKDLSPNDRKKILEIIKKFEDEND